MIKPTVRALTLFALLLATPAAALATCTGGVSNWVQHTFQLGPCSNHEFSNWYGWNPTWTDGGSGHLRAVLAWGTCDNQYAPTPACPARYNLRSTVVIGPQYKQTVAEVVGGNALEFSDPGTCGFEPGDNDFATTSTSCRHCSPQRCTDGIGGDADYCRYPEGCPPEANPRR